jgi:hypothetical protein
MDYSVIAESMGCSEFAAKMLFQRAKKALKKELSLYGFGKGSMMMALILFGKMTAPSEAAEVSVAAATTKVGVTAGLVGILGSKTTIVSLAAAGAVAVGAVVGNSSVGPGASQPPQAADECWYYFPESADGPVMMWAMNSGSEGKGAHCLWRQNERGNYRFDRRKNTVYIQNHRMWQGDLGVWRLPTDQQKLREFLSGVDGQGEQTEYVRDRGRGLVVISRRDKDKDGNVLQTIRHQHLLEEERFLYDWPAAARTVDNRDAMHKRGWTYFRVDGQISGEKVRGVGRIPFVYEASRDHTPWLALKVGSRLKVVDNGAEALVYDRAGKVTASYAGGSFFAGLARPWMGLHTIDTVRRDAAGQEIPFETRYEPGEEKAEIVLTCRQGRLVYEIDMERDVVDSINVSTSEGKGGELKFRYLQDVGATAASGGQAPGCYGCCNS